MEGKSLEPLTIELPLTERKCLINKQQQQKQKKHTPSRPARGMYIIVSRRKTLHHTRMQPCLLKLPPLKQKEKGESRRKGEQKKVFFILLNSVGKFVCVPSRQTKLSSFNSVTVPGFLAEAAY